MRVVSLDVVPRNYWLAGGFCGERLIRFSRRLEGRIKAEPRGLRVWDPSKPPWAGVVSRAERKRKRRERGGRGWYR